MSRSQRVVFLCAACSVAIMLGAAAPALGQAAARPKTWREQPLTDELVLQAVRNGVDYLLKAQTPEGHWEMRPIAECQQIAKDQNAAKGINSLPGVYGGHTALVLLALLKSGVSPDEEHFQKGLAFLQTVHPGQVYANALRGALLASVFRPIESRDAPAQQVQAMRKMLDEIHYERDWLLSAMFIDGMYGYNPPANNDQRMKPGGVERDLSNTQYAALGMWLISDANVEVPDRFWQFLQAAYLKQQLPDGSWNYGRDPKQKGYESMTLGALATLFIIWDKRFTTRCDMPVPAELLKSINGGVDWLGKNFDPSFNVGRDDRTWFILYTLYGVERVGVASGLKYFGNRNWWDLSARYILYTQQPNGSWPGCHGSAPATITTAWALLFMSYGRAPVVFNKLDYGGPAQWNSRPRDLARLSDWMGRKYEQLFNWQVAPIERPVDELLDAPILLMSGRSAFKLTGEQKDKLREYVLNGGLLLGEAVDGSKAFNDSFRALARELFPALELSALPPGHPIYTVHFPLHERTGGGGVVPALEGLGNGIRTMIVLCPRDLSCAWQTNQVASSRRLFELGGNLMEYVGDRGGRGLLGRGNSYMLKDLGFKPAVTVAVGRLAWGPKHQWDPEPRAWTRMDVALRNARQLGVTTQPCDFAAPVDPKAVPVVHVTGTTAISLTDAQKANLKNYVADGGVLFSDSAGGSARFNESYVKLAGELFGPLAPARPEFLDAATDKGEVSLRHVGGLPRSTHKLQLLGWQGPDGRWGVLHLPYDLTAAMVAYPNIEPVGLTPESAEKFVAALLKWVAKPAAPAAPPAGGNP